MKSSNSPYRSESASSRRWDSIADSPEEVQLSDEQKVELDRRLEALEKNPDAGSSWDEVRARLWPGK